MKKVLIFISVGIIIFYSSDILSQPKISLENIYRDYLFSPRHLSGFTSMNDGKNFILNNWGRQLNVYSFQNGSVSDTIFDARSHAEISYFTGYSLSTDETVLMLATNTEPIFRRSSRSQHFIYSLTDHTLQPLSDKGKQQLATFSPDSRHVAFVRENNIYLVDLADMSEQQVTFDGKPNEIINGAPDWVYEEEFGFADGFKWSPDGKRIAFYRFDESKVNEFSMMMFEGLYPEEYRFRYPKAGEDNAEVSIHVYNLETGDTKRLDIPSGEEQYLPRIKWTNDPEMLSVIRMNRLQNRLDVIHCNVPDGKTEVVYSESNDRFISEPTDKTVSYLPDGKSFLIISERDKYFHVYNYNFEEKTLEPVTSGDWDVSSVQGIDLKRKVLYYTSYEVSPTEIHLYSVNLDGSGKKKISGPPGAYSADFSSNFDYYLLDYSNANTPPVFSLYDRKHRLIKVMEENTILRTNMESFGFSPIEFIKVPTSSGLVLDGYMIKPQDFDPGKEYPLFIYVYGGPESQSVIDQWNYRAAWFQMLVQEGYIVACIDNRGSNGRGEDFRKITYLQMGKFETIDQLEAATSLGELNYIDEDRIGIFGWSYGGFVTSLCMTKGNGLFRMGIAVAPITHWRYYDTVYTERFMRTPKENPEGYDETAPLNFASGLKGNFLLIHGMADDNVHMQNSVDFVTALVDANKQFDMQFYPNKNHNIRGGNTSYHIYKRMTDYILENL